MKLTTFMWGNLPNLPHLLKPFSEPGSWVPYLFLTLGCLLNSRDISPSCFQYFMTNAKCIQLIITLLDESCGSLKLRISNRLQQSQDLDCCEFQLSS